MLTITDSHKLTVKVNIQLNYLYIRSDGFFNVSDTEFAVEKSLEALDHLKPGFIVVNDISNFQPAQQESSDLITGAQMTLMERKVSKVIRIMPHSQATKMQLEHCQADAKANYETIYVSSIEEAKKLLTPHKTPKAS